MIWFIGRSNSSDLLGEAIIVFYWAKLSQWFIGRSNNCHFVGRSNICVKWLIHKCMCAYVWNDSSISVTWLMHMCDMTHSYVWHDSFVCVQWLIHTCTMWDVRVTSRMRWSQVTQMNEPCNIYELVMSHIWMSYITLGMKSCCTCTAYI